ncbi:MAG: hypothetical protein JEZ14_11605 [Marinilabiliaceae bacterium]|nr:hypothetical protein [Marinilabiliaceae bacterium]
MPGKTIPLTNSNSIKSYRALVNTVRAAELSLDLFKVIADPLKRSVLKQNILNHYFPTANLSQSKRTYSSSIETEILHDPTENYVRKVQQKLSEFPKELKEQELVVHSHTFRKVI